MSACEVTAFSSPTVNEISYRAVKITITMTFATFSSQTHYLLLNSSVDIRRSFAFYMQARGLFQGECWLWIYRALFV